MRSDQKGPGSGAAIRCLDLFGSGVGLVLLSPVLLALGLLVRLTSPGPALFRATRVGRRGRPFVLLKFRSMVADAPGKGPAVTAAADDRITAVGRVLRKAKLDELPQLINVLKGEMSLVGPRPEDPSYVSLYSRDQLAILDTRPGITSPASISYRDESSLLTGEDWEQHYTQEVMPAKIELDLEYARGRTWRSDLGVIVRTITSLGGGGRNERKDGQGGNRPFDA